MFNHNLKRILWISIGICFFLFPLCAQNTYQWRNVDTIPIYFKVKGASNNIGSVTLTINTNGNMSAGIAFYLTYPDKSSDKLSLAAPENIFNRYEGLNASNQPVFKQVQITETPPGSKIYILQITQNPLGTFFESADNIYMCTISGLGTNHQLDVSITSDVGNGAVEISPYMGTTDDIPFKFVIPGGLNIHQAEITFDTITDQSSLFLDLTCPDGRGGTYTNESLPQTSSTPIQIPTGSTCSTTYAGSRKITFVKVSGQTGKYLLTITVCPSYATGDAGHCGDNYTFTTDETWKVIVRNLSVPNQLKVTAVSKMRTLVGTTCEFQPITPDPIRLNYFFNPVITITSPTVPSADPYYQYRKSFLYFNVDTDFNSDTINDGHPIDFNAEKVFTFDDMATVALSYLWDYDGHTPAAGNSTVLNPTSENINAGIYEVKATCSFTLDEPDPPSPNPFYLTEKIVIIVKNAPAADIIAPSDSPHGFLPATNNVDLAGSDGLTTEPTHSFSWNYGDGGPTTDSTLEDPAPATFALSATAYTVGFTVTETFTKNSINYVRTVSDTTAIVVKNRPTAVVKYNTNGGATYNAPPAGYLIINIGDTVYFSGATSTDPSDPYGYTDRQYQWDWDSNGTADTTYTTTATGNYKYLSGGPIQTSLRIKDHYGIESDWVPMSIAVRSYEESLFPGHIGLPYSYAPPTIDGWVHETGAGVYDVGWTACYAVQYNKETTADVTMQMLRHNTAQKIYVSFEAADSSNSGNADFIAVGLWPDGPVGSGASLSTCRLLVFYPNEANLDNRFKVYKYSGTTWSELTIAEEAAIGFVVGKQNPASPAGWSVEIEMPSNAVTANWIDIGNDFYYWSLVQVTGASVSRQYSWPTDFGAVTIVDTSNIQNSVPTGFVWGLSHKNKTVGCSGVYIESSDIGVRAVGDTAYGTIIDPDGPNEFVAKVKNDTVKFDPATNTAEFKPANDIYVEFRIANWGIGNEWIKVPGTASDPCPDTDYSNNPTCEGDINAATNSTTPGFKEYFHRWDLTTSPITVDTANGHQCLKAEIFSKVDPADPVGPAYIRVKSMWRNMNFEGAGGMGFGGGFHGFAYVGTRELPPLPPGMKNYNIVLQVEKNAVRNVKVRRPIVRQALLAKDDRAGAKKDDGVTFETREENYIEWIVKGYINTGKTLTINGKKYPVLKPIGSFGYHLDHQGGIDDVEYTLVNAEKIDANTYSLSLMQGDTKKLEYTLTPVIRSFKASLHGGVSTPLNTFANTYSTGWNTMIDLGFKAIPSLSLYIMGLAGYNWFPPVSSSGSPTSIINLSLNLKYFIPVQPFLELGIGGGYDLTIQDLATLNHGYDADVSLDYIINPFTLLELGTIYHSRINQEYWFLQSHLGIIFRF